MLTYARMVLMVERSILFEGHIGLSIITILFVNDAPPPSVIPRGGGDRVDFVS